MMKRLLPGLVVAVVFYFALTNFTAWILIKAAHQFVPYSSQFEFQPTWQWGKISVKNVDLQTEEEVHLKAEHADFYYSPFKLITFQDIPVTIVSKTLKLEWETGVAGFAFPLQCPFENFNAKLILRPGRKIDLTELDAQGPMLACHAKGWLNLHKQVVDMEVRLVPKVALMQTLLSKVKEDVFSQSGKDGTLTLHISGNTAHPAVQFQSDLIKVSFQ